MAKIEQRTIADKTPIGAFVQSMLTEAQFQALNGTSWILADGRSIAGTKYAEITGLTNAPDARGLVLRSKNNGRSDGNQNPDGDLALGALQGFGTNTSGTSAASGGLHTHTIRRRNLASFDVQNDLTRLGTGNNLVAVDDNYSGVINQSGSAHSHTISGGANETRMRNLTANTFIKVNP